MRRLSLWIINVTNEHVKNISKNYRIDFQAEFYLKKISFVKFKVTFIMHKNIVSVRL